MSLEGKVAVVTGAAGGIGRGIAQCLSQAGAKVALTDLDGEGVREAAAALGGDALAVEADASEVDSSVAAIETILGCFGGLDVVVNNAGVGKPGATFSELGSELPPLLTMDEEDWDAQLASNLRTAFATSKAAIPRMPDGGSIVNIASIAALNPAVMLPAYGAAKAAVVHLTRTLAVQLAPRRIRVNAICPGILWTRAWELITEGMRQRNPDLAQLSHRQIFDVVVDQSIPFKEEQTGEDIGNLVVFLSSDLGRKITGQGIAVDGGISLVSPPAATEAEGS